MTDVFLVPGFRTPFVKAGGAFAKHNAIALSLPVVRAMNGRTPPDLMIWGQVIPDATVSNISRELIFEAGTGRLEPIYL
jgi:acetyl-CoA C-acetyltransferase